MRLFDLVVPKNEIFLDAFYFALQDTLVSNDIKSAQLIALSSES
jgi:hypothetical protein